VLFSFLITESSLSFDSLTRTRLGCFEKVLYNSYWISIASILARITGNNFDHLVITFFSTELVIIGITGVMFSFFSVPVTFPQSKLETLCLSKSLYITYF
jgi:hypothetical protein